MEIILASFNRDKAREVEKILSPISVRSLADLGVELDFDAIETGETYEENALIKARCAAALVKGIAVADDSGLDVDALGGRPGIHSARYGGADSGYAKQCDLLLEEMRGVPAGRRGARFVCVAAAITPDGAEHIFRGVCEGEIHTGAAGESGFGFDPVFYLPDRNMTMAQISPDEKNRVSHRADAFRKLKDFLSTLI